MRTKDRTYLTITNPTKVGDIDTRISFYQQTKVDYHFHYQDDRYDTYQYRLRLFRYGFSNRYSLMCGMKSMQVEIGEILDIKQFVAKMLYMMEWHLGS